MNRKGESFISQPRVHKFDNRRNSWPDFGDRWSERDGHSQRRAQGKTDAVKDGRKVRRTRSKTDSVKTDAR